MSVSMLRSALEELVEESLDQVDDGRLVDDLVEITDAMDTLEAERLRRVAAADRRGCGRRDGILSTTALLVHRCGMAASTAREKVRVARALESMPVTRQAFHEGFLAYSKVRMLATARDTNPSLFTEHEETLVDAIAPLTIRDARVAVAHWRNAAQPEAAVRDMQAMHEQRGLTVSATFDGMVHVAGQVDPVDGGYLTAALDAVTSGLALADARASQEGNGHRTPSQRRMDGLVEICRQWLTNGTTAAGGERPHVNVTIDLASLERRAGRRCTISGTSGDRVIDGESARMLACDAGITRIITTSDSMPLDVGRRTRSIPAAIRTALAHRDNGCRFPGCDRPPSWTDAHHRIHWADGGPTSLDNLILLCRRHHVLVHRGGFTIDADLAFHRPDGTKLE